MTTTATWQNWSGGVTCAPRRRVAPRSEAELADLLREARRDETTVRVAGSGHSFVPLCATDGLLLSLDAMQGIVATDPERREATILAGTELHRLGEPLLAAGLGLANMGDIDRQALAGAVATGTHGTGPTLGSLSTQIVGLRLLLASGDPLDCSPTREPAVFAAARLSLGLLGVVTHLTLRLLPAYRLHERSWALPFDDCLTQLDDLIAANRHFEFFWSPPDDACALKVLNPTDRAPWTAPAPPAAPDGLARYLGPERVDWSHRIFPSDRQRRFNEIEFAVPAADGPACLRDLRTLMQRRHRDVAWPVEYRTQRADDIPLSPAQGRATVTISLHQAADRPYGPFFRDAEAIFRHYRGRPHWGKIHYHRAAELRDLYPHFEEFERVRRQLDPSGRFLNRYLRDLLLE